MLGNKNIKKDCCSNKENIIHRSKTPTYREIICRKCGHILMTSDISVRSVNNEKAI